MSFHLDLQQFVSTRWIAAVAMLILLVCGALYLALFTQAVIPVMDHICGDMWCSFPGGSFFPFPIYPVYGELEVPVTIRMSSIDQFIYRSFLKTGLIFTITHIWWLGTLCYGLLLGILLIIKGFKKLPRSHLGNEDKESA